MRFRANTTPEVDPLFVVSLKQDGEDVEILVNGREVAFFDHGSGKLYLYTGLEKDVGLPLTDSREIVVE